MDFGFGSRTVLVCASTSGLGLLPRPRSSLRAEQPWLSPAHRSAVAATLPNAMGL